MLFFVLLLIDCVSCLLLFPSLLLTNLEETDKIYGQSENSIMFKGHGNKTLFHFVDYITYFNSTIDEACIKEEDI